jgi:acetyl-CoA carboxylase biotin carboxyl carrier protein
MTYIKEIKEMIALMNDNNLVELEIEKDGLKIKLKRSGNGQESQAFINGAPIMMERVAPVVRNEAAPEPPQQEKGGFIKSPMVGTFYRAPSPEAPPFVDKGSDVEVGQVVCIIEAMKLMNEIKSEVKGKIVEILVENGRPVEFGQPIFRIEPR